MNYMISGFSYKIWLVDSERSSLNNLMIGDKLSISSVYSGFICCSSMAGACIAI